MKVIKKVKRELEGTGGTKVKQGDQEIQGDNERQREPRLLVQEAQRD